MIQTGVEFQMSRARESEISSHFAPIASVVNTVR